MNFTRGQDPKAAMNVGKRVEIIKWFDYLEINSEYYEIDDKLNIVVYGSLDLYDVKISELPDNLIIHGCLDISHTNITKLPNNLIVKGSLFLNYTNITELPNNLIVGGHLYLYSTNITKIPDNLKFKVITKK
jgi:hypothetical protein